MTSRYITSPLIILIWAAIISNLATLTGWNSQLSIATSYSFSILGYNIIIPFGIEGVLALFGIVGIIGAITGVTLFGSGISTMAQAIIYKSIFYFGLWGMISIFSIALLGSIPIIGACLWFVLTLFYTVGVQEQIGTHPS